MLRTERQMMELSALLRAVDDSPPSAGASIEEVAAKGAGRDNQLALVRLGVAGGLFAALRAKHADTAAHSLRVTMVCSAWATSMQLSDELHDAIEVAALLHDIGKVGVPDRVLVKPAALTPDEAAIMDRHRRVGLEILRSCCASPLVLEIVESSATWFDGRGRALAGTDLPLGSRMLSIVDAFDAMTSNKVYRRALPQERAINELFRYAGTQFDPELVQAFANFNQSEQTDLQQRVASGWIKSLHPEDVNSFWRLNDSRSTDDTPDQAELFQQKLLENMQDAVCFIDANLQVLYWNRSAERLTGIEASSIYQRRWTPQLLHLTDSDGGVLTEADCPVSYVIGRGEPLLRRLIMRGRGGRNVPIEAHTLPVVAANGTTFGATLMLRDVSPQTSLEARCQNLHEMATKDPLTQVANRAEFDRVNTMFVSVHLEQGLPCSLIICDIDKFKHINDTYGHPAGDEVIKNFGKLLKRSCRPGDLVARYGGEEFVMLCAGCDNATAFRRADDIRQAFSETPHEAVAGRCITASFGVTEIQPGDTPETMLRRADRALLMAKDKGRNIVVQLGTGIGPGEALDDVVHGLRDAVSNLADGGAAQRSGGALIDTHLATMVPLGIAVEKLRGFVADHHAQIVTVEKNHMRLRLGEPSFGLFRRAADRPIRLVVDVRAEEEQIPALNRTGATSYVPRTRFHVTINPLKNRDRREANLEEQANKVLASLKAYLMATAAGEPSR